MKKKMKIFIILLYLCIVLFSSIPDVYGWSVKDLDDDSTTIGTTIKIEDIGKKILGIIRLVGVIASVAILMVIGIKYMAGSVEEKAQNKKSMIIYVVGAFILFTGSVIPEIIYKFIKGL